MCNYLLSARKRAIDHSCAVRTPTIGTRSKRAENGTWGYTRSSFKNLAGISPQEEGDDKRIKDTRVTCSFVPEKLPSSFVRSHLKLIWKTWPWLTLWVLLSNPWSISPNSVLFRWLPGRKHLAPSHMSDTNMQDLPSMANRYSSTQLGKEKTQLMSKYIYTEL